jgi:hypothetical protein
MKTQKITNTIKNIDKLGLNKTSRVYNYLVSIVNEGVTNFRPVYSTGGSWKHSSLVDELDSLVCYLKALQLDIEVGNDSPRGGKTGAFVNILTKFTI